MPVTLVEARRNAQTDLDVAVIDEFRKESVLLDSLVFDDAVNPSGGGATLTYGYRRLVTQPTAAFRAYNSEYTPSEVETQHFTVDLKVLGGSFEDRSGVGSGWSRGLRRGGPEFGPEDQGHPDYVPRCGCKR